MMNMCAMLPLRRTKAWVEYIVIMPICSTVLRGYLYTVPKILFTYPALILALILSLILALAYMCGNYNLISSVFQLIQLKCTLHSG